MSSDYEEASHMIVIVKGIHRFGESPFLEVVMSTMGSLPLMKRGVLHRPSSGLWNDQVVDCGMQ